MSFQIDAADYADTLIVGLGHKARTGKDTIATHLVQHHGFTRLTLADKLKQVARIVFGFTDAQVFGDEKEIPDEWWNDALHFIGQDRSQGGSFFHEKLTPRIAMQKIGTESFRDVFHDDVWVASLFREILPGGRYVVTDVRFPNEADAIKAAGGYLWRVDRLVTGRIHAHVSEFALDGYKGWDRAISNHSDLKTLRDYVDDAFFQTMNDWTDRAEIRLETTSCLGCLGQGGHSYGDDCGAEIVSPI